MKCSFKDCPGECEEREIVHTVRHGESVVVFTRVPALVCRVCGDVLLTPETIRKIEAILKGPAKPERLVPEFDFAKSA